MGRIIREGGMTISGQDNNADADEGMKSKYLI